LLKEHLLAFERLIPREEKKRCVHDRIQPLPDGVCESSALRILIEKHKKATENGTPEKLNFAKHFFVASQSLDTIKKGKR
jgi:hypothetical protein